MAPPPVVTGLSPKEGPPGTRITIRGEFLGNKPNDLIGLTICGCDCILSAEWKSPNKIIARSGPAKGKGEIIVATLSGGIGTSTVQFRAYHETIGPMKESAVWIEESPMQSLAWGRRSLAPSGYSQEDPLGLSIEGNEKKLTEDLRDIFPDASGDLSQDNFSPSWFLLEHHNSTSFEDLKAGLSYLKRKVESQRDGQLSFLKANTGSVIDQLDTLMTLKDRFEQDMKSFGDDPFKLLAESTQKSIRKSNNLFTDVLLRREKAESTRSALLAMSRYKFLFCLPNSVEKSAKREEYDIVVNDYARAKNLFGKTEISMFKRVFEEVDSRVIEIRKDLHNKLQYMPQSVDKQKKYVKAIINLEALQLGTPVANQLSIDDPAWDAIEARAKYLENTFAMIFKDYTKKETELNQQSSTTSTPKIRDANALPNRVAFCEEITDIASNQIPDLWRLGQAYFTGELRGINEPKPGNFKRIILTTIEQFCTYLRVAILSSSTQKFQLGTIVSSTATMTISWPNNTPSVVFSFLNWLPQCLRFVRITYATLIRIDLPSEVLDIIQKLIDQVRLYCLSTIFKKANEKIKQLGEREKWEIYTTVDFPGATLLPSYLEECVIEVLEEGQQTCINSEIRENSILDAHSDGQRELSQRFQEMLTIFCGVLENLAYQRCDDEHHIPAGISQLIGFPNAIQHHHHQQQQQQHQQSQPHQNQHHHHHHHHHQNDFIVGNEKSWTITMTWEHRLLCCLANCAYCNKTFFNNLGTIFTKYGYPIPKLAIESGRSTITTLYNSIIETYVEHKSDPLVGTIEPSMYIGRFQWNQLKKIESLRPYAHECLDNLVAVYSEIFVISPILLRPVLEPIIQTVAEELARLMTCVQKFSTNGAIQANIDIRLIRDALKLYSNETAKTFFTEALEAIPNITKESEMYVNDILKNIKNNMKLQLMCFSVQNPC